MWVLIKYKIRDEIQYLVMQGQQQHQVQVKEGVIIHHPKHQHKHTLIWIHGLTQKCDLHYPKVMRALGDHGKSIRVVMPQAPQRHVTVMNKKTTSWFDIKFRSDKSFTTPFEEAFSGEEVHESFKQILAPLIKEEKALLKEGGKLIVGGFSQGCAMSLHSLYSASEFIDGVVGVGGYLFPITPFRPGIEIEYYVVHGLADDLRPWQYVKITHEGKTPQEKITLVPGMRHEINEDTVKVMAEKFNSILLSEHKSKL